MVYTSARRSRGRRASPTGAPFSGLVGSISSGGLGILPYVLLARMFAICAGLGTIPLAGRAGIETPNDEPEDREAPTADEPPDADADESITEVDWKADIRDDCSVSEVVKIRNVLLPAEVLPVSFSPIVVVLRKDDAGSVGV